MRNSKAASRYSKSILTLALEQNKLEEVMADMKLIASVCTENRDFAVMLKSPLIKSDKKQAILKAVFNKKVSDLTLAFINLLAAKKREDILDLVANEFDRQYKNHKNILSAKLITAVTCDKSTLAKINSILAALNYSSVDLSQEVDEDLIGGLVLKIEDTQIDASVKSQLNDMRNQLSKNHFIPSL